jgi:16S rRNA (uracil1498-N3)-methyltransferase
MHRFYLPSGFCQEPSLVLAGREAHHALHVLRVQPGEHVILLDGAGNEFHCAVAGHDRDKIKISVLEKRSIPPPPCRVTLLQAVPKGKIIESIIQKAAELGAARVVPLISERVTSRFDKHDATGKGEKWQLIAIEAIKQCGSAWLPQIEIPLTPQEFLAREEDIELSLIGSLQGDGKHPRGYFQAFWDKHHRKPKSTAVWVGPEGDFSPQETTAIKSRSGALPVTLGSLVLRSETAAVYCLSVINHELSDPYLNAGDDVRCL